MRSLRLLPAALLAVPAALATVALTGPASAQTYPAQTYPAECAPVDVTNDAAVDAVAREVDDIFAGTVKVIAPAAGGTEVRYQVKVLKSFRGKVAKDKPALVTIDWGSKPATVVEDAQYLFFTSDAAGGTVVADDCNGAVPLPGGLTKPLADQLTVFLESIEAPPAPSPPPPLFTKVDPSLGDPPELGRVVATGGAVSLAGLLGLVLVSRLGRRR